MAGDQSLLKRMNRMALVRLLKANPGLSRVELAHRTGLTKATVGALVQELIDEGWLAQREPSPSQGVGRRPMPLTLDPDHLALLGAELGVDYLNVVAVNLEGEILAGHQVPYRHTDAPRSARDLAGLVARALGELARMHRRPLGIGVGVPGIVRPGEGLLRFAPNLAWRDVKFAALVRAELPASAAGLEVLLLNEANAAALSEYVFGVQGHEAPLVYLSLGVGLGGGIVLHDRLYEGHGGLAGEVGHTILQRRGPLCACGRRGCAETFISQRAVSRQATGGAGAILSMEELAARVARREPRALRATRRAGEHLGLLVLNIVNTIDPALVVLGGPLMRLGDELVEPALRVLRDQGGTASDLDALVQRCRFGVNACAVGAAGGVFQALLTLASEAPPPAHVRPQRRSA